MAINSISGVSAQYQTITGKTEELTSEQQEQIQSILSNYDSENLSEEDVEEIKAAFEEAGITPSLGMKEAIEEAGFDAEVFRPEGPPPVSGSMPAEQTASTGSGIDQSALQTLQDILEGYDLTELSTDDESNLIDQLRNSGLLVQGNILDISA